MRWNEIITLFVVGTFNLNAGKVVSHRIGKIINRNMSGTRIMFSKTDYELISKRIFTSAF